MWSSSSWRLLAKGDEWFLSPYSYLLLYILTLPRQIDSIILWSFLLSHIFFIIHFFYDMSFLNIFCFLSRCGKPPPRTSGAGFFKNYFLLLVSFSDGLFEWVPSDLNISIKIICWDIMHTLTKRPSSWVCWSSTWSSWSSSWSRPHQPREEEASDWTWVEDRTLVRDLVFLDKWSWS